MSQLCTHMSQMHFCGHRLGPTCLPEECPGPHGGLQAACTPMSVCASGLFLPAKVPLDPAAPASILLSPRLTPGVGNEASLMESLPRPPGESPSTKRMRIVLLSPRAKKPLPQTFNGPHLDPTLTPVIIYSINNPKNKTQGRGPNKASSSAQKSEREDYLKSGSKYEMKSELACELGMIPSGPQPVTSPDHHPRMLAPTVRTNSISRHTATIICLRLHHRT